MIIPQFWAEASAKHRQHRKQVTIRRFGWSEVSQAEAQSMAEERASDALEKVLSGQDLERREPKMPYNGAEGVPIREEVLERHDTSVITRNIYGARCLNTPDVLFADVDFAEERLPERFEQLSALLILLSGGIGYWFAGWGVAIAAGVSMLLCAGIVSSLYLAYQRRKHGGPEQRARARIDRFVQTHSDWQLRLYRTPAGFRLLARHRRFDPHEPEVAEFFDAIAADKVYVRMCQRQQCFRARVSPKPWRIGIADHIRPRPGVWPINPDRLPDRERWVAEYERRARDFAACRWVADLGDGSVDPAVEDVVNLHDRIAQAQSDLPIA